MNRQVVLICAAAGLLAGCERSQYGHTYNSDSSYYEPNGNSNSNTNNQRSTDRSGMNNAAGRQDSLQAVDADFMKEANKANQQEVAFGRVGVKRAGNEKVREFAQKMIDDHSKAGEDLRQLAQNKGLTLDQGTERNQSDLNRFSQMSGADFDQAFIRQMLSDHEQAIDMFDREARTGDDASVRSFAARTLPTLREHLRMAKDIQQNLTAPRIGQPNYDTQNRQQQPGDPSNPNSANPENPNNPDMPPSSPTPPR